MKNKKCKKLCEERFYCKYAKRILDFVFSLILLIFLLLPIFIISVIIRSNSSGRAIFKQKRMGRGGRIFVCYKFRTMYENAPPCCSAKDFRDKDKYITPVGRFLRRTSLDELPQLINVLKGDMSLVGPRPLICEEAEMHTKRLRKGIYTLRPGITGMAQVSGRNLLCDEDKIENDSFYLNNIKILLDLKILLKTFSKAFKSEEINGTEK